MAGVGRHAEKVGPPDVVVVVLGSPTVDLAQSLWRFGLRPVRGQRCGTVWTRPDREVGR